MASLEGWCLMPFGHIRMVGPAGSDPASAAFQAAANPSQLESHPSETAESNCVYPVPGTGGLAISPVSVFA